MAKAKKAATSTAVAVKQHRKTPKVPVRTISTPHLGDFIWCPPGSYELDGRKVTLTKGFWMGRYQVTQSQWEAVMGSNPSHFSEGRPCLMDVLAGRNDLPVESVSWNDVQEFCRKAAQLDGVQYRLPTEAEWEYAALAGENTTYSGSNDPTEVAWSSENSGGRTHPVGELSCNAWGFHDMSGNVWEWTHSDWSAKGPEGTDPGWVEVEETPCDPEVAARMNVEFLQNLKANRENGRGHWHTVYTDQWSFLLTHLSEVADGHWKPRVLNPDGTSTPEDDR